VEHFCVKFQDESWKSIYFWSQKIKQRSRSRVTKTLAAWVFALMWVLASSIVSVIPLRHVTRAVCQLFNNKSNAIIYCAMNVRRVEKKLGEYWPTLCSLLVVVSLLELVDEASGLTQLSVDDPAPWPVPPPPWPPGIM